MKFLDFARSFTPGDLLKQPLFSAAFTTRCNYTSHSLNSTSFHPFLPRLSFHFSLIYPLVSVSPIHSLPSVIVVVIDLRFLFLLLAENFRAECWTEEGSGMKFASGLNSNYLAHFFRAFSAFRFFCAARSRVLRNALAGLAKNAGSRERTRVETGVQWKSEGRASTSSQCPRLWLVRDRHGDGFPCCEWRIISY